MVDTTELKESLQREVEALMRARDELKLLVKNEARDEWARLENTFERLQLEIKRIGLDAREPLNDIGRAARGLLEDLKSGYSRTKREVKSASSTSPS